MTGQRLGRIPSFLDLMVEKAHGLLLGGQRLSPRALTLGFGFYSSALVLLACSRFLSGLPFWKAAVLYYAVTLLYLRVYAPHIKRLLFKSRSKSFLQDSLLFVLPVTAAIVWALRIPVRPALDLCGVVFAYMMIFFRLSCFFDGCCFGVPSRYGVLYQPSVLEALGEERKKRPDLVPRTRVFPMQLVEAFFNLCLFLVLLGRLIATRDSSGVTLIVYFQAYSGFRFVADFWRRSSHRPRYGALSEAQVLAALLFVACIGAYRLL